MLRQIERRGLSRAGLSDIFHVLMTMRLPVLLGLMALGISMMNLIFGAIYWFAGGIGGARPGNFGDAFFFSVQTFSTAGYGVFYPKTVTTNAIASVEIITGVLSTALATGLLFARLSRPQARVMFSNIAVIHPYHGVPTLMFRAANRRRNALTNARMTVTMIRDDTDPEGIALRRLIDLVLERDESPAFALSWTVIHRITETSPLFGLNAAALAREHCVLLCVLTGLDDTLLATVAARHVYDHADIRFGARLADIFDRTPDGSLAIDYTKFHDTED
ncbi:ion channel [Acidiphilium sp.]|uniref:ion channel n=1 Tax=Acidiphilium sp. TaxID=527 RepID=UPI003D04A529